MKRNILPKLFVIVGFIFFSLAVFSQASTRSVLSIGTKQGVNFSKINFEPPVSQKLTMGYTGGLVIKYLSDKHAGIQAELNYSKRGWTEDLDSSSTYKRSLSYLEVPILTHFIWGKNKTKVFMNLGPNLSFFRSGKEEINLQNASEDKLYYQRHLDKKFELGLMGGLGINRVSPIGDFQLEFRFHYGLQNIFSNSIETDLAKSQNQLYAVTLTYFFFKKDFRAQKNNPS